MLDEFRCCFEGPVLRLLHQVDQDSAMAAQLKVILTIIKEVIHLQEVVPLMVVDTIPIHRILWDDEPGDMRAKKRLMNVRGVESRLKLSCEAVKVVEFGHYCCHGQMYRSVGRCMLSSEASLLKHA